MSSSDGSQIDPAREFLDTFIKNPENWIPDRIAQELPAVGDNALLGKERNDIKGKVMNGIIRV
tara:strand:+ start:1100 stop:1288 length:189 start_codon:yes stop_codon:yes gene_type:complete